MKKLNDFASGQTVWGESEYTYELTSWLDSVRETTKNYEDETLTRKKTKRKYQA